MRFADLVATSDAVARAGGRLEKIALLASLLKRAAPEEIEIVTAFLSGTPRQGRIGLGGAALHAARNTQPADSPNSSSAMSTAPLVRFSWRPVPDRRGTRQRSWDGCWAARPATSRISSYG